MTHLSGWVLWIEAWPDVQMLLMAAAPLVAGYAHSRAVASRGRLLGARYAMIALWMSLGWWVLWIVLRVLLEKVFVLG